MNTYPSDHQAEQAVLGAIINKGSIAAIENAELLNEDCFYTNLHLQTFKILKEIEKEGSKIDIILISSYLRKNNQQEHIPAILDLANHYTADTTLHVLLLREKHMRRKMLDLSIQLNHNAINENKDIFETIDQAKKQIDNLLTTTQQSIYTLKEAISGVFDQINRNLQNDTQITGIPTGLKDFDRKSGGLQKSDLVIIAAETSQGKTSLALSITHFAAKQGAKAAIYSLEMKKEQLAARIMSIESQIPTSEILYTRLHHDKITQLNNSVSAICDAKILFDDRSTSNIETIIASIRTMKNKYDIDFAVIDYLQILNVNMKNTNKEAQMGEVARRLKNLAKELDICIIALSQLNRNATDPVPNLNRLRDSGQISEAADIVMFIYRPEYYGKYYPDPFSNAATTGTAMIDVAKGRNIGLLKFLTHFNPKTTHFTNADKIEQLSKDKKLPF